MVVDNLLSGLIGAVIGSVIGGYIQYMGSIKAAEKSIAALFKQEADRSEEKESSKRQSIVNNFIAEINENISLAEENQISHAKIKFITDAWTTAKANIPFLKSDTQGFLQSAYIEIHKYNALVDYDYVKVDFGRGYLDTSLKKRAESVKKALLLCKECLK
jgi:hypothetical protein